MATAAEWIEGARPRTLPAAVAPVLAGTGLAVFDGGEVWWKAGLALVVALALQVAVNYANDYSDGIRGTDDARVGPLRLVGSGAARPQAVKYAAFAAFAVAAVAGLVLSVTSAWWLVLVGLACIAGGWLYTGGSKPYGYMGLGELMVFVFFGLVAVMGTYFVQVGNVTWPSFFAAVGVGAIACAILVVNNLRDIPTDTVARKRTLAVVLGDRLTRLFFAALYAASLTVLIVIALTVSAWALLGAVFLLPAGIAVWTVLQGAVGRELIPALVNSGKAELLYGAGLFLGLMIAA